MQAVAFVVHIVPWSEWAVLAGLVLVAVGFNAALTKLGKKTKK